MVRCRRERGRFSGIEPRWLKDKSNDSRALENRKTLKDHMMTPR